MGLVKSLIIVVVSLEVGDKFAVSPEEENTLAEYALARFSESSDCFEEGWSNVEEQSLRSRSTLDLDPCGFLVEKASNSKFERMKCRMKYSPSKLTRAMVEPINLSIVPGICFSLNNLIITGCPGAKKCGLTLW